jgi:hypothetical protein
LCTSLEILFDGHTSQAKAKDSVIEDPFGNQFKNLKLGGKTFPSEKDKSFDTTLHFGMSILSQYVEQNASKIDFTGFTEILARLAAAIDAHRKAVAQNP